MFSVILTRVIKKEQIPTEIILAWPNMKTYQNLCVAHAPRIDDVS